jgi:hypothetical protein
MVSHDPRRSRALLRLASIQGVERLSQRLKFGQVLWRTVKDFHAEEDCFLGGQQALTQTKRVLLPKRSEV